MKKSLYFIVFTLFQFSFVNQISAADTISSSNSSDQSTPFEPSIVAAPKIPKYVIFCGDTIRITRYDMYERFDREMMAMMYMHSSTLQMLKKANRLFPTIDLILSQMGVPADLKYLAVIESSLNIRAISPAKAVGLWQLMPYTGKQYGLEVNDTVDERFQVEQSTVAACKMLKDLYSHFKNWSSVAAAYNIGPGRISTELKNQSAQTSLDLWLVEETSRYVFRILAAKELFSHPRKYGFLIKSEQFYKQIPCTEVVVNSSLDDLYKFATDNNTTYYLLKDFNAWLRGKSLPNPSGKLYKVKIPLDSELQYNDEPQQVYSKSWVSE